jgi:hypothetical protein
VKRERDEECIVGGQGKEMGDSFQCFPRLHLPITPEGVHWHLPRSSTECRYQAANRASRYMIGYRGREWGHGSVSKPMGRAGS